MKNILYFLISFAVCLLLNLGDIWVWFALSYFLFSPRGVQGVWAIPMGALAYDIVYIFSKDSEFLLARVLFLLSAAILSLTMPKKLFVFFPVGTLLMFLLPDRRLGAFFAAAVLCGAQGVFLPTRMILPQFCGDYKPHA